MNFFLHFYHTCRSNWLTYNPACLQTYNSSFQNIVRAFYSINYEQVANLPRCFQSIRDILTQWRKTTFHFRVRSWLCLWNVTVEFPDLFSCFSSLFRLSCFLLSLPRRCCYCWTLSASRALCIVYFSLQRFEYFHDGIFFFLVPVEKKLTFCRTFSIRCGVSKCTCEMSI